MIGSLRRVPTGPLAWALAGALGVAGAPTPAEAAATILISNSDAAGEGFNDATPVAPVGGNPGTTIGEQRLRVFETAAAIWGAALDSSKLITVRANFDPLTCTATTAVLGSAGTLVVNRDFTGAPFPGTWYPSALADKLSGLDLVPSQAEIGATFNSNLGSAGCLTGSTFYYGVDNAHGAQIDLLTVVLHELGHGLGFQTFTAGSTGAQFAGFPAIWDRFLRDATTSLSWDAMTDAQRAASAISTRKLVWDGANVTAAAPGVLGLGTPRLAVTSPAALSGAYLVGSASFGPPLSSPGLTGEIMPYTSQPFETGPGCDPFNLANSAAAVGRVMLIDRGVCGFAVKVKNAQNAGAIGVLIGNNAVGSPPPGLGGTDPTVTIPSVMVSQTDATNFKMSLRTRSRTRSGMFANLGVDLTQRAGTDALGRALMYTPNPYQAGSSVSHWDTVAFPNLLMEPAINADLTHAVSPPADLTLPLLRDIGW